MLPFHFAIASIHFLSSILMNFCSYPRPTNSEHGSCGFAFHLLQNQNLWCDAICISGQGADVHNWSKFAKVSQRYIYTILNFFILLHCILHYNSYYCIVAVQQAQAEWVWTGLLASFRRDFINCQGQSYLLMISLCYQLISSFVSISMWVWSSLCNILWLVMWCNEVQNCRGSVKYWSSLPVHYF